MVYIRQSSKWEKVSKITGSSVKAKI